MMNKLYLLACRCILLLNSAKKCNKVEWLQNANVQLSVVVALRSIGQTFPTTCAGALGYRFNILCSHLSE